MANNFGGFSSYEDSIPANDSFNELKAGPRTPTLGHDAEGESGGGGSSESSSSSPESKMAGLRHVGAMGAAHEAKRPFSTNIAGNKATHHEQNLPAEHKASPASGNSLRNPSTERRNSSAGYAQHIRNKGV